MGEVEPLGRDNLLVRPSGKRDATDTGGGRLRGRHQDESGRVDAGGSGGRGGQTRRQSVGARAVEGRVRSVGAAKAGWRMTLALGGATGNSS